MLIPLWMFGQVFDSLGIITKNQVRFHPGTWDQVYVEMEKDTISEYTITRIDSFDSFYLIYAKNDQYRYKIKSERDTTNCSCKTKIEVNHIYQFDLRTFNYLNRRIHIDDSFIAPTQLGINCDGLSANDYKCREDLGYYTLTDEEKKEWDRKIILGGDDIFENRKKYNLVNPSVYDLFSRALNLRGLCLVKKD